MEGLALAEEWSCLLASVSFAYAGGASRCPQSVHFKVTLAQPPSSSLVEGIRLGLLHSMIPLLGADDSEAATSIRAESTVHCRAVTTR